MDSGEDPSDIIRKARRKLAEALLQIDPELILDATDSHLLFTQREFFSLSKIKSPEELIESLIDMMLVKEKLTQESFLDCLENLRRIFPSLQPISEYLEEGKRSQEENLEDRAANLDAAVSPERGTEVENLDLPMSLEAGSEEQSPDVARIVLLDPSPPSKNDNGIRNLDASDVGNTVEKPDAVVRPEEGTEQSSFQASEDLSSMQSRREPPRLTTDGNRLHSGKMQEYLKGDGPLGTYNKVSMNSGSISGEEMIRKGRKQIIEVIQKDLELFLDEFVSQSVITEEEYAALDKNEENSKKKIRKLLIQIQKKGEAACMQFLECLETVCPGTNWALQGSIHEHSFPEEEADCPGASGETNKEVSKGPSSQQKENETEQEPEEEEKHPAKERRKALKNILIKLKLRKHKSKKFALQEILEISSGSLKEGTPNTLGGLPWHFLRKVLALNVTARNTSLEQEMHNVQEVRGKEEVKRIDELIFFNSKTDIKVCMNPLDVLCAILLCSDSFLQQEIFSKMSLCQFALPLLLPPLETPKCTLMLWAMRDIVKKWRPHSMAESRGFKEESLVVASMPTISFVRMGRLNFSKSKLLNEFLCPSQQHHDYFLHQDMECGNIPREIADGLVEVVWYFPGGQKSLDLFPEPVAVANLRGDVESHQVQFSFLSQVSSAVFIFAEYISEKEYTFLSSLKESSTQFYFILEEQGRNSHYTLDFLNKLVPVLKLNNSHILVKAAMTNKAEFVEMLRCTVGRIINSHPKTVSIEEMPAVSHKLPIQVDEDDQECQNALQSALEITGDIKDVVIYKKQTLTLQGDLWKNLAKVEKEMCRMERQGDIPSEKYRSELKGRLMDLRKKQNACDLKIGLMNFVNSLKHLASVETHFFLKWMKFKLDHIARENLSKLRADYKEKCKIFGDNGQKITEVDQLISSSSLGVEHFMRELGQFYEAECSMVKEGKIAKTKRQYVHFPSIAADLLMEGFPLELIDGDASNIPMQWITDVLTKLNNKLRGRSKMMVITVLGVQSTGKSTLLNTMFGLQFAVSSGRCTRGAFMTLLKVRENLFDELGCDFILVIDTEGLKAPELAKLEDSYQHDNELATLVIGLSDITIVNMAMENATEMKDILQIVTHAFLRMERIGQKPNCQFVHQNVSDVSAHDQNMRDRKHLLEQLNEMTQAAAKMEKINKDIKFSDIMDYDPEMHNWYIPGLWHGAPPMAPVNRGYSEKVFELKKYIFECIGNRSHKRPPKDIPQFIEWVKSLWNAVKHENFIFSFRNSLVAEAYNHLSILYSEWDWDFRREMHLWVSEQENVIQNVSLEELDLSSLKCELQQKLTAGEQKILENLQQYFESGAANLHLVERYKEDFVRSAKSLKNELEYYSYAKCKEAINIKKGRLKIDTLQAEYLKILEGKVDKLLEECQNNESKLEDEELKKEFECMWTETMSEISPTPLEKRQIYSEIDLYLRKEFSHRGSSVNLKVQEAKCLLNYRINTFQMKAKYIHSSVWYNLTHMFAKKEHLYQAEELAKSLIAECSSYMNEKVNSKGDYDETYCGELLQMINRKLQQVDVQNLHTTSSFEVDLKLHILGEANCLFQKMHEDFIKVNDPYIRLEKLKPLYLSTFKDLYLEKDALQNRAKNFCDQCLYPALVNYTNKRLGIEIMSDILNSTRSLKYASRSFFQYTLLKELLEEKDVNTFVDYIMNYKTFVQNWIYRQILDYYDESDSLKNLEKEILSKIVKKVWETLEKLKNKEADTLLEFLDSFCREMQKELVINKENLVGMWFKNISDISAFSTCIENFLPDMQNQILSDFDALDIISKLSNLSVKPQDEVFKKVFGCGRQCPFCKVPCEAGGNVHEEHFAAIHRPQGLGRWRIKTTQKLHINLCSTDVATNREFYCPEKEWNLHPYKEYRVYYPDWSIQPDPSINASDYWKFIFKEFNDDFAREFDAKPADLPEDWKRITKEQALQTLKEIYNMK